MQGYFSPLGGLKVIMSSPKNIIFAVIPFLIGLFVVGIGYFAAASHLDDFVHSLTEGSQFFKDWTIVKTIVDILLVIIGWILVSLLNIILGYLCIIILAGPFYALMVENIFKVELPDKEERSDLRLMINMFLYGLGKAIIFLMVGLICFILAWIPGLNFIAPFILTLTVAFDCADYAFEVDFLSLRQRFRFFTNHIWHFVGLGLAILTTGLIPGAFFVLLPLFICGATKMYIQLKSEWV